MKNFALPAFFLFAFPTLPYAEPFRLGLPVACTIGKDCDLQNYVDRGESEPRDYQCQSHTYKGHDGTDFRVRDAAKPTEVLAAAAGRVRAIRDGETDGLMLVKGTEAVKGRECGNGLIIDHADGWSTQYCHLAKGSLRIKAGERVTKGQVLGLVGLSGLTEFRHLHLTVQEKSRAVDPFDVKEARTVCGGGQSLWDEALQDSLKHQSGTIINTGFANADITGHMLELGEVQKPQGRHAPALIAYARAIHLIKGDRQILTLTAPDGKIFARAESTPLETGKAQYLLKAGRKLRDPQGWPVGIYKAHYEIIRAGKPHAAQDFTVEIAE